VVNVELAREQRLDALAACSATCSGAGVVEGFDPRPPEALGDMNVVERPAARFRWRVPRPQLEWLAAHGEVRHASGESDFEGPSLPDLYVVLAGRFPFV
jgi:hypothetical protein